MDPRHSHEFDPNKRGLCKQIIGSSMCHLPEDAPVHRRFAEKQAALAEEEKHRLTSVVTSPITDVTRQLVRDPEEFKKELAELINRHSAENHSNTPDFILAEFLFAQLETFGSVMMARDRWWSTKDPSDVPANPPIDDKLDICTCGHVKFDHREACVVRVAGVQCTCTSFKLPPIPEIESKHTYWDPQSGETSR